MNPEPHPWLYFQDACYPCHVCPLGKHLPILVQGLGFMFCFLLRYMGRARLLAVKLFFTFPPLAKLSYLQGDIVSCSCCCHCYCCLWQLFFFKKNIYFHIALDYVLITFKIKYLRILSIGSSLIVIQHVFFLHLFSGEDNKVSCGKYCGRHIIQPAWRVVHSLFPCAGEYCILETLH